MATLEPPSSQKAGDRPISFLLDNQADGAPQAFVDLVIRPEELSRSDPSRMVVQQTLGGGWIDSFGAGLAQINISGHTGWRRRLGAEEDGLARFAALKEAVFDQWHLLRERNVERGLDPNMVRLIFSDALSERSMVVAPMNFVLRRSRTRPLLAQYQISMTVVSEEILNVPIVSRFGFQVPSPELLDITEELALESLADSTQTLTSILRNIRRLVAGELAGPVSDFLKTTIAVYSAIRGAIAEGTALAGDLINIARLTAQAGINLFRSLAAVLSIPKLIKAQLVAVASAYMNIFCTLRNALSLKSFVEDYSNLYGASNCSSTAGGRPASMLAGQNPFYAVVPTPGPLPVNLTQSASVSLSLLAQADPVLSPLSGTALRGTMESITAGFKTNEFLSRYMPAVPAPLPQLFVPGAAQNQYHVVVNSLAPTYFGPAP